MATHETNVHWLKIFIKPCWRDYKNLPYINEPFNDPLTLQAWSKMGYSQTKFTGDMYDMKHAEPDWMQYLRDQLDWKYFSWSLYRMTPGCLLPEHADTYARFREIYKISVIDFVCRAVVFLEDWQQGHYFDIAKNPVVGWKAGDTVIWQNDVPHTAANIGTTNRYTLQITGVPRANPFV